MLIVLFLIFLYCSNCSNIFKFSWNCGILLCSESWSLTTMFNLSHSNVFEPSIYWIFFSFEYFVQSISISSIHLYFGNAIFVLNLWLKSFVYVIFVTLIGNVSIWYALIISFNRVHCRIVTGLHPWHFNFSSVGIPFKLNELIFPLQKKLLWYFACGLTNVKSQYVGSKQYSSHLISMCSPSSYSFTVLIGLNVVGLFWYTIVFSWMNS